MYNHKHPVLSNESIGIASEFSWVSTVLQEINPFSFGVLQKTCMKSVYLQGGKVQVLGLHFP